MEKMKQSFHSEKFLDYLKVHQKHIIDRSLRLDLFPVYRDSGCSEKF